MSDLLSSHQNEKTNKQVVRLSTSYYLNNRGIHQKRSINFLRRLSRGHEYIKEDAEAGGADVVFERIINLNDCEDGVYKMMMVNESRDWESGNVEDWDYQLVKT